MKMRGISGRWNAMWHSSLAVAVDLVEGHVGLLGVYEDDHRVRVQLVAVGPDVEVAVRAFRVAAGGLEPRVRVAGVVDDQVRDDPDAALVRLLHQLDEIADV